MLDRPSTDRPIATAPQGARTRRAAVWDLAVRVFHWSLVAATTLAAWTGFFADASWIDVHVRAGTAAAALIGGRIVWGFLGSTHARFADFVVSPAAVLAHVRALVAGHAERHRGHNPLGGVMVLALLFVVAAIAVSGAVAFGGVTKAGPLAFVTGFVVGAQAREIHETMAIILVGLIALHAAGVVFESRRTRENLLRAMLDGRKELRSDDHRSRLRQARPLPAAAVTATLFIASASIIVVLSQRPGLGVPVGVPDPVYAQECGACHTAYHPSLLPRASWSALVGDLAGHFGENASLDADATARIAAYLAANAAETADTLPANRLRLIDAAAPFTITATPFWKRRHAGIADAVFASKPVSGRGNCDACHADAGGGRFYPGNIHIPAEARP